MTKWWNLLFAGIYLCAISIVPAKAQTASNYPVFAQTFLPCSNVFGSGTAAPSTITLCVAGSKGAYCTAIVASSNDTVGHNLIVSQLSASSATVFSVSTAVNIAAGYPDQSGGGPAQPVMTPTITSGFPLDQNGNQIWFLGPGETLIASNVFNNISSGTSMWIKATCWSF